MKFSLSFKLILVFSVIVLVSIFSIAYYYYYYESRDIIKSQISKDLSAIAEGTEGQIFLFFDRIKIESADWSSDGYIRQQTDELVKTGNQDFAKSIKEHLLKNKMPLDLLVIVTDVLDVDMKVIASSDEKRVGVFEEEHAEGASKEELMALKYGEATISQVRIEQASEIAGGVHPEYPVFHSLTPIKSSDNETTIGFLLLHFSNDNLNKIVQGVWQVEEGALSGQEFILNQKTSEMFLVNKDGFMITQSRFIGNSILNQKIDSLVTRECFNDKKEYNGSYVGYLGREVQVASMCLIDYDIVLLAEIETDEFFSPLKSGRNNVVAFGLVIWAISTALIFALSNFLLKNIKTISDVANSVAKNNFNIRANIKSRDEIGDLANTFNHMLDNIERSKIESEDLNKKLHDSYSKIRESEVSLELKIRERTKELEDIKATLEIRVHEKTAELQNRLDDLEKFRKLTTGRELRMIELKEEINILKNKLGRGGGTYRIDPHI